MQETKDCKQQSIHPDFETHRQSHLKAGIEGTSGPTKWIPVQQNHFKNLPGGEWNMGGTGKQ